MKIKKMWKWWGGALVFAMTPSFVVACTSNGNNQTFKNIKVVSTNDMHGRIEKNEGNKEAGVTSIAGYLSKNNHDLLLDGGDLIQGTALNDIDKGLTMAKIADIMNYDAIAVGNHEFDFGLENILKINPEIGSRYLSANARYKENNERVFKGSKIKVLDNGLKAGIIGLSTPETKTTTHPGNVEKLDFTDVVKEAENEINNLEKQGINFIVVVLHDNYSISIPLAEQLKDKIDLIIDGHSHESYYKKVGTTHIIQAGEYTKLIRESTFDFNGKTGFIENFNSEEITYEKLVLNENDCPEEIRKLIEQLKITEEEIFSKVVGNAKYKLEGDRAFLRKMETNLGNFATDALYLAGKEVITDLDFSIINSGGIRSTIQSGVVTKRDIYNVFPFGNKMVIVEATGENIKKAFDYSISKRGEGAMLQVSEQISINFSTKEYKINNTLIDDKKTYKFATNDFISAGGDGYEWFDPKKYSTTKIIQEFGDQMEYLEKYLQYVEKNNLWEKYKEEVPSNPSRLIGFNFGMIINPSLHNKMDKFI